MRLHTASVLWLLASPALGGPDLTGLQDCARAVQLAFNYVTFAGNHTGPDFCRNPLKVDSIHASFTIRCDSRDLQISIDVLDSYCENDALPPSPWVHDPHKVTGLKIIDFGDYERKHGLLAEPVTISNAFYDRARRTAVGWRSTYVAHHACSIIQVIFWAVVFAAAASIRLLHPLVAVVHRRIFHTNAKHSQAPSIFGDVASEIVVIYTYWVLVILLSCVGYYIQSDSLYFQVNTVRKQIERFLADRTGIMCYGNLSLIWLFSGRNNILLYITNWNFPTFIRFHYHVALAAILQGVAHTIVYTLLMIEDQNLNMFLNYWMILGTIATVTMTLMYFLSLESVRRKWYEIFIDSHIVLGLISIVGLFYHTTPFVGFSAYLWVPVAIWCLDRALRGARIVLLNLGTKTTATYDEKSNVITLDMTISSRFLKPIPGGYFFLYEPLSIRGYENHPMTAASYESLTTNVHDRRLRRDSSVGISSCVGDEEDATNSSPLLGAIIADSADRKSAARHQRNTTLFLIRPYDGWTRRLRDKCQRAPSGKYHPWILAEGPYGHELPLHAYDGVLFVVGGAGISVPIPYLQQAAKMGSHRRKSFDEEDAGEAAALASSGHLGVSKLRLVWTAREPEFIRHVVTSQLNEGIEAGNYRTDFYCSRWSPSHREVISPSNEYDEETSLPAEAGANEVAKNVMLTGGRPDFNMIIQETAHDIPDGGSRAPSRLAVVVCGPFAMTQSVKTAVKMARGTGGAGIQIELFEEAFTW